MNFWDVSLAQGSFWMWRQILKLRPLVQPYLYYHLGKGNLFSLLFDPWLPSGSINHSFYLFLYSSLLREVKIISLRELDRVVRMNIQRTPIHYRFGELITGAILHHCIPHLLDSQLPLTYSLYPAL